MWPTQRSRACLTIASLSLVATICVVRSVHATSEKKSDGAAAEDAAPPCDVLTAPAWRSRLSSLTRLSLANCGLTELPASIGLCVSLAELDLAHNDLTTLPAEFSQLTRLEILFVLGSRRMKKVPEVLGQLGSLTRLGLRSNGIVALTGDSLPPNVVHLILTDNAIASIDDAAYARLTRVRKLMLANNALTSFTGGANPARNLRSLELLRLANNELSELPLAVLSLPKLCWVALAGNAFLKAPLDAPACTKALPRVSLAALDFSEEVSLGKGASGVVRGAVWRGASVAVKQIAARSSDGLAEDEIRMYDCVFGGAAAADLAVPASLVRSLAVVDADEGSAAAVVMERLPRGARDLAKPPTIVEVTRDRYGAAERFSARVALRVATALASALRHLHAAKVAHGDCYAHNVLLDDATGMVKLADFGASFEYTRAPRAAHALFERLEVRAFGVLVAELATRQAERADLAKQLLDLADTCLHPDVRTRPSFAQLVQKLDAIHL